jgi:hypothetical protein
MSYVFNPLSDEEIDALSLVDAGEYPFTVIKSTRKISQAGNPMAELVIEYWDSAGISHTLFDYLVFSSVPLNIRKIKHFCDAVGLQEEYKRGDLPEELERLGGVFKIGISAETPKKGGGFYPKKNIVIDYLKKTETRNTNSSSDMPFDDEIAF